MVRTQSNPYLPEAIVIGGILAVIAAIIFAAAVIVGPMLWTDHLLTGKPVPTGCSIQSPGGRPVVVHCPSWVQY
jgi:hypothetical protein